jgi:hypothetical protein
MLIIAKSVLLPVVVRPLPLIRVASAKAGIMREGAGRWYQSARVMIVFSVRPCNV